MISSIMYLFKIPCNSSIPEQQNYDMRVLWYIYDKIQRNMRRSVPWPYWIWWKVIVWDLLPQFVCPISLPYFKYMNLFINYMGLYFSYMGASVTIFLHCYIYSTFVGKPISHRNIVQLRVKLIFHRITFQDDFLWNI